jgi:hypothetical protein
MTVTKIRCLGPTRQPLSPLQNTQPTEKDTCEKQCPRPLGHNGSSHALEVVDADLVNDATSGLADDALVVVLAHLMTSADGDADGHGDLGLVDVGGVELGVNDIGGSSRSNLGGADGGGERPDLTHCDGWMR